jgi:hypothetical protein
MGWIVADLRKDSNNDDAINGDENVWRRRVSSDKNAIKLAIMVISNSQFDTDRRRTDDGLPAHL